MTTLFLYDLDEFWMKFMHKASIEIALIEFQSNNKCNYTIKHVNFDVKYIKTVHLEFMMTSLDYFKPCSLNTFLMYCLMQRMNS